MTSAKQYSIARYETKKICKSDHYCLQCSYTPFQTLSRGARGQYSSPFQCTEVATRPRESIRPYLFSSHRTSSLHLQLQAGIFLSRICSSDKRTSSCSRLHPIWLCLSSSKTTVPSSHLQATLPGEQSQRWLHRLSGPCAQITRLIYAHPKCLVGLR